MLAFGRLQNPQNDDLEVVEKLHSTHLISATAGISHAVKASSFGIILISQVIRMLLFSRLFYLISGQHAHIADADDAMAALCTNTYTCAYVSWQIWDQVR